MNSVHYLISAFLLIAASLLYFKVARKFNIVDVPNHRTMHEGATIRGGGIVIFIAIALFSFLMDDPGLYFITGIVLLGIIGFMDDIFDLPGRVRFPLQVLSIIFLMAETNLLGIIKTE